MGILYVISICECYKVYFIFNIILCKIKYLIKYENCLRGMNNAKSS